MTEAGIKTRLDQLPAIFPDAKLYFVIEVLEEARRNERCSFVALGRD
jgi:hypothetical protein